MTINFSGTWQADLSRSKLLGPSPKAFVVKIEHAGPLLRQEMVVTRHDGNEDRTVFLCNTDGQPDGVSLNGRMIRGTAGWENDELVIESWIQAGPRELHFRDHWSQSPDGQTLTMEHRDDDLAGQITILKKLG